MSAVTAIIVGGIAVVFSIACAAISMAIVGDEYDNDLDD